MRGTCRSRDRCNIANGGELAVLSQKTLQALDTFLPPHWSHNNPIDILGDAEAALRKSPGNYLRGFESDGLLAILAPQAMTDPAAIAKSLEPYAQSSGKPVLSSWMGGASTAEGEKVLNTAGIPTFLYPDTAARAFTYMWRYSDNLRALYETPTLPAEHELNPVGRRKAESIIEAARLQGRVLLNEFESKQILSHYGIPVVETQIAATEDEAVLIANQFGYPIVLKIFSETITHKTDVDGVKLNLADAAAVRSAFQAIKSSVERIAGSNHFSGVTVQPMVRLEGYELIIGSSTDPQFGPVLLFGSGGPLVEVYRDHALALPPLNTTLAQRLMEQTRIFAAFKGVRGRQPIDLMALAGVLVRFSQLVVEQPWISENGINPLLASPERLLALDARVVLHSPNTDPECLPTPAIRPYPSAYVSSWVMKNGTEITLRPIRPEDEPAMARFHETLSDRSVYLRYFYPFNLRARVAHDRLVRICFIGARSRDCNRSRLSRSEACQHNIFGVGRLIKSHARDEGEVAVLISDDWQNQGLGFELFRRLIQIARAEKLTRIFVEILPDNFPMKKIAAKLGFRPQLTKDPSSLHSVLDL